MAVAVASYLPSDRDVQTFWEKESTREKVPETLPLGFPKYLKSSLAWIGSEVLQREDEWTLCLTEDEVASVNAALAKFEARHEQLSNLSRTTFELPDTFSTRLRSLSDQIYEGVGFQLIRGLNPADYNPTQILIVYAGITAHICPERGFIDVRAGKVVSHIVNVQAGGKGPATTAPAFTDAPLSFHTDNCEVMAFFYIEPAAKGGETILSSLWQTYNELASRRPDVVHTLAKTWVFDSFKSYDFQKPRIVRPLQTLSAKIPILFRFSRYGILGWQRTRNPDLPAPTQAQIDAADAIQFISMKNSLKLPARKGDLLLVNDMALCHAREGFDDGGDTAKRHLIKMHVRDPDKGWTIPGEIENEWKNVYGSKSASEERREIWNVYHYSGLEEESLVNG